jgi:hypothetical protein
MGMAARLARDLISPFKFHKSRLYPFMTKQGPGNSAWPFDLIAVSGLFGNIQSSTLI